MQHAVPLPDISESHIPKGLHSYKSHRHIPNRIAKFYGLSKNSFDPNINISSFWSGQLLNDYSKVKPTIIFDKSKTWKTSKHGQKNSAWNEEADTESKFSNPNWELKGYWTENDN